jgi:hypothetical protein
MLCPHQAKCRPQYVDMVRQQRAAIGQIDREEITAAG